MKNDIIKELIQGNDFFRYMIIFGVAAFSFVIIYYSGKEVGKFVAEFLAW